LAKKLILIGSGAFDEGYAASIMADRLSRLREDERMEALFVIDSLDSPDITDRDALMARFGALMAKADSCDPLPYRSELLAYQYDVNQSVWHEAAALRKTGELLAMGKRIKCPVVAIHGDYDPHLAEGVREPLSRVLKDFRFILLEKCGHEPWIERYARDRFYEVLKEEIGS
jgi:pimeloyl-ACP methyl ester carboxylesterase